VRVILVGPANLGDSTDLSMGSFRVASWAWAAAATAAATATGHRWPAPAWQRPPSVRAAPGRHGAQVVLGLPHRWQGEGLHQGDGGGGACRAGGPCAGLASRMVGPWEEDADVSLRSGDGWRKGLIEGPALGNPTRHGPESRALESG
jgi:hypothetical protein